MNAAVRFNFETANSARHCEEQGDEAIHFAVQRKMDCFVARAPRNDGCASNRLLAARCARVVRQLCPSKDRGRRESRVLAAPAASRAEKKHTSVVATGSPKHSGLPCARVYGIFRALLGDRALLPPSLRRNRSPRNLTPASGRQDHTALPSALGIARLAKAKASTASRPTFVTMANAPLLGETAKVLEVICPTG